MLVWIKKLTPKKFILIGLFVLGTILMDAYLPAVDATEVRESRFLGIGIKTERPPCLMGRRQVHKEFTLFWIIRVGDPWWGRPEPCE